MTPLIVIEFQLSLYIVIEAARSQWCQFQILCEKIADSVGLTSLPWLTGSVNGKQPCRAPRARRHTALMVQAKHCLLLWPAIYSVVTEIDHTCG